MLSQPLCFSEEVNPLFHLLPPSTFYKTLTYDRLRSVSADTQMKMTQLLDLPHEILISICAQINDLKSLFTCAQTCREINLIYRDNQSPILTNVASRSILCFPEALRAVCSTPKLQQYVLKPHVRSERSKNAHVKSGSQRRRYSHNRSYQLHLVSTPACLRMM